MNNSVNASFEKVTKYQNDEDVRLPERKTKYSAGYDFYAAQQVIVPSYENAVIEWENGMITAAQEQYNTYQEFEDAMSPITMDHLAALTKKYIVRPTLVSTGVKCKLPEDHWLSLAIRSSTPLKYWIIMANGIGVIDADYYNNADNEGEIFFQLINLSPFDVVIKKGECIGQGIILPYSTCQNEKTVEATREGGFGSTNV